MSEWFEITNPDKVLSPALLFYPDRIQRNIEAMIKIGGSADRLRPHVKTYKCHEIVDMQLKSGIQKFKCATLVEAEMLAKSGVKDVLISYPLVGPNQKKFIQLSDQYPETQFSTLIDHESQIVQWKSVKNTQVDVFIDLDVGMHRTGIAPEKAATLIGQLGDLFKFRGLHIYDGHIHNPDPDARKQIADESFKEVDKLIAVLETSEQEIICGGSITFPIHAQYPERQLSPGTTLLWDYGYASQVPDLKMLYAAVLMTRVVSKPGDDLLCLDVGYKAVASEMDEMPVYFPQVPDATIATYSEEHMVIKTSAASNWEIGDLIGGIPWHICPTVALHEQAGIVKDKKVKEYWTIEARRRDYQL